MKALNDCFDQVVCINLDRRQDRWQAFQRNWAPHLTSVDRLSAFDGWTLHEQGVIPRGFWGMRTPGFAGSWLSHQKAIRDTPVGSSILVFEDDAVPTPDFGVKWPLLVADAPADWEGIWFGYDPNHRHIRHITDDCIRHFNPLNTHCYVLRGRLLEYARHQEPQAWGISHWDGMLQKAAYTHSVYAHHGVLVRQAVWDGANDPMDNYVDTRGQIHGG